MTKRKKELTAEEIAERESRKAEKKEFTRIKNVAKKTIEQHGLRAFELQLEEIKNRPSEYLAKSLNTFFPKDKIIEAMTVGRDWYADKIRVAHPY